MGTGKECALVHKTKSTEVRDKHPFWIIEKILYFACRTQNRPMLTETFTKYALGKSQEGNRCRIGVYFSQRSWRENECYDECIHGMQPTRVTDRYLPRGNQESYDSANSTDGNELARCTL